MGPALRDDRTERSLAEIANGSVHGEHHRELTGVRAGLGKLRAELEPHRLKEERVLFPMLRALAHDGWFGGAARS